MKFLHLNVTAWTSASLQGDCHVRKQCDALVERVKRMASVVDLVVDDCSPTPDDYSDNDWWEREHPIKARARARNSIYRSQKYSVPASQVGVVSTSKREGNKCLSLTCQVVNQPNEVIELIDTLVFCLSKVVGTYWLNLNCLPATASRSLISDAALHKILESRCRDNYVTLRALKLNNNHCSVISKVLGCMMPSNILRLDLRQNPEITESGYKQLMGLFNRPTVHLREVLVDCPAWKANFDFVLRMNRAGRLMALSNSEFQCREKWAEWLSKAGKNINVTTKSMNDAESLAAIFYTLRENPTFVHQ